MLSDNIKVLRKAKGLSQEELAVKINVVRQTVSKWEKGLSVPDAQMLTQLAEALDVSVSELLGEPELPEENPQVQILAAKLEVLNAQFAKQAEQRRKIWRAVFIVLGCAALLILLLSVADFASWRIFQQQMDESLTMIGGADGPTSIVVATAPFEWAWIPALLLGAAALVGICLTRKK